MPFEYPISGQTDLLNVLRNNGLKVRLFKNDYTPTNNTVIGDLVEADFDGYSAVDPADFGDPFMEEERQAILGGPFPFLKTAGASGNTVYGFYVTVMDQSTEKLLLVRRFDVPKAMTVLDATFSFFVKIATEQID